MQSSDCIREKGKRDGVEQREAIDLGQLDSTVRGLSWLVGGLLVVKGGVAPWQLRSERSSGATCTC